MEIGSFEITPFSVWLLGPNWSEGLLFRPGVLPLTVLVVLALPVVAVAVLRRGSLPAARWCARAAILLGALASLAGGLVGLAAALAAQNVEKSSAAVRWLAAAIERVSGALAGAASPLLGRQWTDGALVQAVAVIAVLAFAVIALGWLGLALSRGPRAAGRRVVAVLAEGLVDLATMSPRRVAALSRLAMKEAVRRRAVVVFALFAVILLFAGWFLDPGSPHPARLYVSFVLTTNSYLVLLLTVFLAALSLPADIQHRTLHTVLTKPARRSEVVLGRMIGLGLLGTILLAVMAAVSYGFVVRGVSHRHDALEQADVASLLERLDRPEALAGAGGAPAPATPETVRSSLVNKHRHSLRIDPALLAEARRTGRPLLVRSETAQDHWHEVTLRFDRADGAAGALRVECGPPRGMFVARVPFHGKLRFIDRSGQPSEKGVNVGDEWTYRSYIEGGGLAAAIWTFEGVDETKFPRGLPVEMTLGVFRTHKGDMQRGVPGSLTVRNPRTGLVAKPRIFESKEFTFDQHFIPRQLVGPDQRPLDLFADLVDQGRVEIVLRCVAPQQYFGAAQADLYLRARDGSFAVNFAKGFAGIWLQMMLLIAFGVAFSTFLSGPIAVAASAAVFIGGLFREFVVDLGSGRLLGGGPVESLRRLVTQDNMITEYEPGLKTTLMLVADRILESGMWAASHILPDFGQFGYSDLVANGFDVSGSLLAKSAAVAAGFVAPVFVAGYFFLKLREVAE